MQLTDGYCGEIPEATIQEAFDVNFPTEQRIEVIRAHLPEQNKTAKIETAEKNSIGEHVRYYRQLGPKEIEMLLSGETVSPITNPTIRPDFATMQQQLLEQYEQLLPQLSEQDKIAFHKLKDRPSIESFLDFSLHCIPKYELFKLHVKQGERVNNYFGIMSISPAIPFLNPQGFKIDRSGELSGSAVAEFVIPNEEVIVNPKVGSLREEEKEVNVLRIKPEWLIDVYCSPEDFADRFMVAENGPFAKENKEILERDPYAWIEAPSKSLDRLMEYKHNHSLKDLIPISMISDADPNNPALKLPLLRK